MINLNCKADSPEKIISDFKSALALIEQYDYGETHEWLGDFQKIMVRVYNNSQIREDIESLMIEALKGDASPASKQMICSFMGPIASGKAVPVLKKLIMEEHLSAPALSVIQYIPDEAADEVLLKVLSDTEGSAKAGVINVLALRKTRSAVKTLKKLIFEQDVTVSTSAVFALGKIGTEEACDALKKSFVKSSGPLRWKIADAWLYCADNLIDSNVQDALLIYREVIDAQPPPAILYMALQGALFCDEELGESFIRGFLNSNEPETQSLVIPLLRDLKKEAEMSEYLNMIPQLEEYQQIQLFTVLADRNNREVKDILKRSAEHSNPDIRLAALMAMRNLASADDVVFLATIASKTRGRERDMARECLELSGDFRTLIQK
jgi:HEAT repeat protein